MKKFWRSGLFWVLATPVVYVALSVAVSKAGKMAGTPTITFNLTPAPTAIPTSTPSPAMLDHHARWQQLFVSRDQKQIFSAYAPFQAEPLDDGNFIGDADGQSSLIRVWNALTGEPLYNISPQDQNRDFKVSDDGTLLLANPTDNGPAVEPLFNTKVFSAVYNAHTGVKLWTLPEDGYGLFAPRQRDLWVLRARPTSPDSEHFVEHVEVRDAQSGKLQRHFSLPEAFLDSSTSYVRRRDGGAFALVSTERTSRLWSILTNGARHPLFLIRCDGGIYGLTLSPDEHFLAFICYQNNPDIQHLTVWNLARKRLEFESPRCPGGVPGTIQWSRDSRTLAWVANMDSGVYLWRLDKRRKPRIQHVAASGYECAAAFYPDNQRLLIGDDKGVRTLSLSQLFPSEAKPSHHERTSPKR